MQVKISYWHKHENKFNLEISMLNFSLKSSKYDIIYITLNVSLSFFKGYRFFSFLYLGGKSLQRTLILIVDISLHGINC